MPPSVALLVNPSSRRGRAAMAARRLLVRLRARGVRPVVLVGRSAADSARLAREAARRRPDALVAVGGDGMVHTALQAAVAEKIPLGILPAGTGNDIARELGFDASPEAAAERVLRAECVDVDTATVTAAVGAAGAGPGGPGAGGPAPETVRRHYLSVLACGFDSRVNQRVNAFRFSMGQAGYLAGVAAELRSFRPIPYRIEVDGRVLEAEGMLAAIGNTRCYGGGMAVCPDARPDDGLLDVVFVHAVSVGDFLRFLPRVFSGGHTALDEVEVVRGARVRIDVGAADGRPVVAYADGEPIGEAPFTCESVPGGVRVLR